MISSDPMKMSPCERDDDEQEGSGPDGSDRVVNRLFVGNADQVAPPDHQPFH